MTESSETEIFVEIIDEGPCQKRMKAEVPAETVVREVDSSYQQLVSSIQLPGFRKGRVPRSVLERRYSDKIEEEVKEELLHTTFVDEVEKLELNVLGAPTFDNVDFKVGEPMRFDALFEVAPVFELGDYKGLEIEPRSLEVASEEVDRELQSLRDQYATWEDVELGEQRDEDVILADVVLGEDEQAWIRREDVYLKIGHDRVDNIQVDGLSERLRGATHEDELEFEVTLPSDFPREDLRDKSTAFKISVKSAKRMKLPEIDAEFLEHFGVESEELLREKLLKNLETRRRIQEEHRQEEDLIEGIAEGVEMELPPSVIERRKSDLALGMSYRLMREGKDKEEIEEILGQDTTTTEDAHRELKQLFILDRIARQENILITEDEVQRRIQAIALTYNRDPEEVLQDYAQRGELDELRNGLLREKVRKFIPERAKLVPSGSEGSDSEEDQDADEEPNAG